MDDTALVWITWPPITHGRRQFKEMFMPGEIDLRAMRYMREHRFQELPEARLKGCFQTMQTRAVERVVPDHDFQERAAGPERPRQPAQLA
jgi:hypothetical protein